VKQNKTFYEYDITKRELSQWHSLRDMGPGTKHGATLTKLCQKYPKFLRVE